MRTDQLEVSDEVHRVTQILGHLKLLVPAVVQMYSVSSNGLSMNPCSAVYRDILVFHLELI